MDIEQRLNDGAEGAVEFGVRYAAIRNWASALALTSQRPLRAGLPQRGQALHMALGKGNNPVRDRCG